MDWCNNVKSLRQTCPKRETHKKTFTTIMYISRTMCVSYIRKKSKPARSRVTSMKWNIERQHQKASQNAYRYDSDEIWQAFMPKALLKLRSIQARAWWIRICRKVMLCEQQIWIHLPVSFAPLLRILSLLLVVFYVSVQVVWVVGRWCGYGRLRWRPKIWYGSS